MTCSLNLTWFCRQTMEPIEVARMVHRLFSAFDRHARELGLFKVRPCKPLFFDVENSTLSGLQRSPCRLSCVRSDLQIWIMKLHILS